MTIRSFLLHALSLFARCKRAAAAALLALAVAATPAAYAADPPVIAAFGDSLSAGYGLSEKEGFAPQLQAALAQLNVRARVVNAAVSGDTSADGLRRVDFMLRKKPDMVIIELGANDMLRGMDVKQLYKNLDAIIRKVKASGAKILLAGMLATPTLGEKYRKQFAAVYRVLAKRHKIPLYPFFLKGVATVPSLNLPDGVHPNAKGVRLIAKQIAPKVAEVLQQ